MRYSYSSRNFLGKTCHNSCVLVYISNRIMILAAHMLGGMLPCERILKKCAILMRLGEYFDQILY